MYIMHFHKSLFVKLSALLAFSLLASGCHTGNEPEQIPKGTANKEKPGQIADNKTVNNNIAENGELINSGSVMRDPFALPATLQLQKNNTNQQSPTQKQKNNTVQMRQTQAPVQNNSTQQAPCPQEPCIAGVFDNGREKFALLRWQQVQGVFRKGEPLGNGYYIKEITAASVLLCPEHNNSSMAAITLLLH